MPAEKSEYFPNVFTRELLQQTEAKVQDIIDSTEAEAKVQEGIDDSFEKSVINPENSEYNPENSEYNQEEIKTDSQIDVEDRFKVSLQSKT